MGPAPLKPGQTAPETPGMSSPDPFRAGVPKGKDATGAGTGSPGRIVGAEKSGNTPVVLPKDIDRLVVADLKERNSTMEQLARNLDKTKVPSPFPPPIKEVFFMGTGHSQEEADALMQKHFRSPIDDKPYDKIFAFGKKGDIKDLVTRSGPDNVKADRDLLSDETTGRLEPLRNAHIDRLVAHSNGATVAEVLIRNDFITVKELYLMGGDRSLTNLNGLEKLAKDKGIKITVFANPGDPVVTVPKLSEVMPGMGPVSPSKMAEQLTYKIMGLHSQGQERQVTEMGAGAPSKMAEQLTDKMMGRPPQEQESRVKVIIFDGKGYINSSNSDPLGFIKHPYESLKSMFWYHESENYDYNVRKYRRDHEGNPD
jgi:hypothetical protein